MIVSGFDRKQFLSIIVCILCNLIFLSEVFLSFESSIFLNHPVACIHHLFENFVIDTFVCLYNVRVMGHDIYFRVEFGKYQTGSKCYV